MSGSDRGIERTLLGGTVLVAACVPKVPATIVIDATRPPVHQQRSSEAATRSKPSSDSDRMPPQVIRAELLGASRVRIHFSEPVVIDDGFNPNDFRISYLRVDLTPDAYYSGAYYYDVGYLNYGTPAVASQARVRDDRLEFDVAPGISPWFCQQLEHDYRYEPSGDVGLFLHYAAGPIPVRDEDGNMLTNFGADWVVVGRDQPPQTVLQIHGAAAATAGKGLVRVACSPTLPPGPR